MSGGFWDAGDHDGPAVPRGRRMVLCVSCPSPTGCDSLDVIRERSTRGMAYWVCETCGWRWKEDEGIGKNSVKQAMD